MIKIHISPGEEIITIVSQRLKKGKIIEGSISLIGAVDSCCISTMPKSDAQKDILTEYHEPLELSGTGEVIDGKPHIHAMLGREGDKALVGHLHWAKVKSWFVNVYIRVPYKTQDRLS